MQIIQHQLIGYLQQRRAISDDEQEMIAAVFLPKTFKEGEKLTRPNQINRNLFFICKGVLRIVLTNDSDVEVTHFFLKENQFCTIQHSFINEVPAAESIQAACNAEVVSAGKAALEELYRNIDWLKPLIDGIIQQALVDKIQLRNGYLGLDASARYRLFLSRQPEVASRISLHDIATYLGITQQSLSRIRRTLS